MITIFLQLLIILIVLFSAGVGMYLISRYYERKSDKQLDELETLLIEKSNKEDKEQTQNTDIKKYRKKKII